MDFLSWHYTIGLKFYSERYISALFSIIHYFSLPLLIPTLFAPWKRLIVVSKRPGFRFLEYLEEASFNFVSRFIGAAVRMVLFITGLLLLLFVAIAGVLGYIPWLLLPFVSISIYSKYSNKPSTVIPKITNLMRDSKDNSIGVFLKSKPGQFFVHHTGIPEEKLMSNASSSPIEFSEKYESFVELMQAINKAKIWSEEFLRTNSLSKEDLLATAYWWDRVESEKSYLPESQNYQRAGIGLELLYGYTPTLDQYGTDMSTEFGFSHRLIGRENIVQRIERVLKSGNSVILIGPPGVGKRTVILEFAHKALIGDLGPEMAYRRVVELDYNFVFSESIDMNQKKVKLAQILTEAEKAGNVILVVKDLHRFTNPAFDGVDFTDVFETAMDKRGIKIIGISTKTDYERYIAPNAVLRKFFEHVEVNEPTQDDAYKILIEAASRWEEEEKLTIHVQAIRKILDGSSQYITETPFPEKALELLDAVVIYHNQDRKSDFVTLEEVNEVLSEKTGISFSALSKGEISKLANLEELIHERLVNQNSAVDLISKILRSKSVGVINTSRPIGSFLFLGPTGVGKTETAKVLAKVYFGSEKEIIRFDMAEYVGREGLERLIGSVEMNQPGVLTTAIKNKPSALLLLDEIEKAPPEVYNLFLSMLDEGAITDAFGKRINCNHLFIVATTNAGAEFIRESVSTGSKVEELQKSVVDYVMKNGLFSPEFINRFDGVVVYEPLTKEHLVKVARILLTELAQNLQQKNVYLNVSNEAAEKLASDGYEPEFGARPMRRIIDLSIGDLLGKAILEGKIKGGDKITILPANGKNQFTWEKS